MSAKEIDRLAIIQLVISKRLSVTQAAKKMGLSRGHASRLVNAYRLDGAIALASGHRGKPANNRMSRELRDRVCGLVREYYSDFGQL